MLPQKCSKPDAPFPMKGDTRESEDFMAVPFFWISDEAVSIVLSIQIKEAGDKGLVDGCGLI